ncbi:OmpA family protein [Cellulophaga sp. Hel_I_12]|uniref:OmpA family protein n=1 Tax=Cellulophaga sp. Hel_I_12 TaxID=1249972 RepID=UPI0006491953|nr:OmpA family protein [Cellulophaga sp. Hel_I_12]
MKKICIPLILILASLNSCKDSIEKNSSQDIENQDDVKIVREKEITETKKIDFEITKIPLSSFTIIDLPFFNLPDGYEFSSKNNRDYESIRFWTGNDFELPEGSLFYGRISTTENKQFSILELTKNLNKVFTDAGGVELFQGKVPREAILKNEESNPISDYGLRGTAYGFQGYAKTWTYVIRQDLQNVWIQLNESDDRASLYLSILKTKPIEITTKLINADQMKLTLDQKGMVALYINYDTNKSDIKVEALPTLDEIFKLLSENPNLKISIEGHTDNVGNAQYNMQLSELRAKGILDYLTTKGIKGERLKSAGFGDSKPIAANNTEENKALNRRVELRKIS